MKMNAIFGIDDRFYKPTSRRDVSLGRINNVSSNVLHPVRDASLTGCKGETSRHFLPSGAFLTECRIKNYMPFLSKNMFIMQNTIFAHPHTPVNVIATKEQQCASLHKSFDVCK